MLKKIIGYGIVYLFGLGCVLCMMLRTNSLDNKVSNHNENGNVYVLNK